jgi:hypothetical protein
MPLDLPRAYPIIQIRIAQYDLYYVLLKATVIDWGQGEEKEDDFITVWTEEYEVKPLD